MINKLRELANNATQVKWSWDGRTVDDDGDVYIPECSYLVGNICLADQYEGYVEDCDFIAAANPIAIGELIQQRDELLSALKSARRALAQASTRYSIFNDDYDLVDAAIAKAELC